MPTRSKGDVLLELEALSADFVLCHNLLFPLKSHLSFCNQISLVLNLKIKYSLSSMQVIGYSKHQDKNISSKCPVVFVYLLVDASQSSEPSTDQVKRVLHLKLTREGIVAHHTCHSDNLTFIKNLRNRVWAEESVIVIAHLSKFPTHEILIFKLLHSEPSSSCFLI